MLCTRTSVLVPSRSVVSDFCSPGSTVVNNLPASARDARRGSNPWVGKIPGKGNDNPLQYSCLENSMDRGVLWATVHGVTKSQTQLKRLSMHVHTRGIQMLSVITGHHSRRFQCSACELERNRAKRTSETTTGFSVHPHGRHWHLEWTNSSLNPVAFQDFSAEGIHRAWTPS